MKIDEKGLDYRQPLEHLQFSTPPPKASLGSVAQIYCRINVLTWLPCTSVGYATPGWILNLGLDMGAQDNVTDFTKIAFSLID